MMGNKAKNTAPAAAPPVMIQNCTFSAGSPHLEMLARAALANAEAIKTIADHLGGPLLPVGGNIDGDR